MQVSRWGNSLAVRLPAAMVATLRLKEGDEVEVRSLGERGFTVERKMTREEAMEAIKALPKREPIDWKFDREELHERPGMVKWQKAE